MATRRRDGPLGALDDLEWALLEAGLAMKQSLDGAPRGFRARPRLQALTAGSFAVNS